MRILLISHQLDYSGAPLALLELAAVLKGLGHDLYLAALSPGPVGSEFLSLGVRPYRSGNQSIDLFIANTVLSVPAALDLAPSPDSVLAWIHETEFFFRLLGASARDFSLEKLRYAAFPARFQVDEYEQWMPTAARMQLRNCVRMPPGDPAAPTRDHYICSGRWEARKNQARLLELLEALPTAPTICFVGADPPAGLPPGKHGFPGTQAPRESKRVIAQSKGLISPSLAEAQPLAAIEALMAGRPVLLSDIAAHRELKQAVPDLLLFDPGRIESFVSGFAALEEQSADEAVRSRLRADAMRGFGPEGFAGNVRQVLGRLPPGSAGNLRPA
ncbi:MAG: glycosyltransferase family 4 protein [Steroidobacteraceae bacterium]|nr:glycosyltransferase family 4 protein [Steroidobacteraceae bacterium]